jgi:hypothetical protein
MPDTFAGVTLNVRQIGAEIPVRTWGSTLLAGTVSARPAMLAGTVVATLFIATAIVSTVPVTSPTTGDFTIARCIRAVLPPKSVHRCGVWETLDLGYPNI